ncbi:hypothetical protein [Nocardia sp. NPDC051981]|uniref:hypothetical protein n=1 Tax=Nocardia sp. NPDC051981 TaxID=3155417 RepID=UPI003420CD8B
MNSVGTASTASAFGSMVGSNVSASSRSGSLLSKAVPTVDSFSAISRRTSARAEDELDGHRGRKFKTRCETAFWRPRLCNALGQHATQPRTAHHNSPVPPQHSSDNVAEIRQKSLRNREIEYYQRDGPANRYVEGRSSTHLMGKKQLSPIRRAESPLDGSAGDHQTSCTKTCFTPNPTPERELND